MVFSSVEFLFLFLPLLLLAYVFFPWRNLTLLLFSLLFYGWGEGIYVLLLLAVILMNYLVGNRISSSAHRKAWLTAGVSLNLAVLIYFKYLTFVLADVLNLHIETNIRLPIGVSFFIFQSISYLVDVYRKHAERATSIIDLGLYISLFPQLIAGPIVRYNSIAHELKFRISNLESVSIGLVIFSLGLSQKVLVADIVALPTDQIFALEQTQLSFELAWMGALLYSIQILFDFAGYSLMAIGLGRIFGFHFPENFNYPYCSRSITEFWRRWHMSLSRWFRDYLYIPLGGNRKGNLRTVINLFTVFILCGLWHGAAWTFLTWGLFHGFFLAIERLGLSKLLNKTWGLISNLYVWLITLIGWVIFRSESFDGATSHLATMFSLNTVPTIPLSYFINLQVTTSLLIGLVLSYPILRFRYSSIDDWYKNHPFSVIFSAMCLFIVSCMQIFSGGYSPFIYFRF